MAFEVYNLTYSTSILESLGVLSSFNISETIWEKYEEFAILDIMVRFVPHISVC